MSTEPTPGELERRAAAGMAALKRSDLTTEEVLRTVCVHGTSAWTMLRRRYPPKIVLAAYQREVDAGRLDYGVSLVRPWLTPKGVAWSLDHNATKDLYEEDR